MRGKVGEVTILPDNLSACKCTGQQQDTRYRRKSRHDGHSDALILWGEKAVRRANQHILPGHCLKVIVATEQQIGRPRDEEASQKGRATLRVQMIRHK